MKGVYGIPYGATELKLPGGVAIPIGEEAFRTRAFYVPFQRVFRGEWRNSVDGQLVPKLMQAAGLTPEQAKMVGDLVYTLGENGGKLDIMSGLRKWVGKPQLKPTLQSLGIPPELLSPSAVRDIENLIVDALPQDAPEVMRRISEILMRERNPAGQIMSLAGVQPGIRSWSDVDLADEVAWLTANLLGDARRAGLDPTAVQTQAQAIAKAYVDARTQGFERLAGDIAQVENNPNLWSMTMDYFTDLLAKRNAARATVDAASQEAVRLGTPDAWQRKWQITQQAWENLGKEFLTLSDEYRTLLAQPGEYTRRHDWWDTISKYLAWDEAEFRRIRGIDLGSVGDEAGETWQRVINNNREFVDNKLFELFGAFQRYPSLENFDVVRYTIQRIESIGAQTAATLADARQSLAEGKMSKTAYAKLRNKLWNAMFDSQAIQADEMARAVVMNGLAEQTQSGLRWFDPFNNQEYRLLGKAENGKWKALNVETGEEELFDAASSMNEVAPFVVPLDVVNDFERMTGNDLTPEIDQVLGDIASQRPTNLRPDLRPPFEGAQSPNAPVLTPAQRGLSPADQAMTGVPAQSAPTADELAQAVGAAQNRRAMSGTPESVDDPLGYNQFADVIGQNVPRSVQDQFQVHGTDAQGAIRLLEGGVDPSRPLQSGAPIDYSGQGGVLGTRSQNPVLVISAPGQPIDEVRNVVLNGPAADTIDLWRQRYPGVNFMTAEEAAEWMQGGQRLSPAERAMTLRENMFPAGDDLPLPSGTTYGPADKGPFVPGEPPARQIPPVQRSLVGRPPARETAPMSQELTQGRFVPPASGEQTVATVPTDNELRQLAIDAGISTAGETGTPNNRWLLNVLNKDLGIQVDSLGQLSDAERILARQALQERAAKSVTTPQRAVTPDVAPVDYRGLTKAQIIAQYGDELAEQGITPAKAKRMTKRELDVALGRADETPLTTTGDLAQEEIEGLRDARDSIRREWDAKVASQVEGIPQIDVLIMRFKRDGGVNLNVGAGKTTGLEKLYAPDEALKGGK